MKVYFLKRLVLILTALSGVSLIAANGFADPSQAPKQDQEIFYGFTKSMVQSDNASPYGIVTGQDVIPLVVGSGVLAQTPLADDKQYNAPFEAVTTSSNSDLPTLSAETHAQLVLGTMLQTKPIEREIQGYSDSVKAVFDLMDKAALPPITSSSSYNSVGNMGSNTLTASITQAYANPYDSQSLFNYISPNHSSTSNPASMYISLVDGALTPVPLPSSTGDDFNMQLRRIAAIQTAGVNALQQIFDRSKPVFNSTDADNMKNTLKALGDTSIMDSPKSQRNFEEIMATHRLNPNNTWYSHLQQANPVELQRQQLYLQAEMLYEMHQLRKEEEQNKLLLAINLLAQNYQSRQLLNVQSKMSASALKALTASTTGSGG